MTASRSHVTYLTAFFWASLAHEIPNIVSMGDRRSFLIMKF